MAKKEKIEIEVNVDIDQVNIANTSIVNLTQVTDRAAEAASRAEASTKNYGETLASFGSAVLDNGVAMDILNKHTHGYFDKVKNVVEVTKLFVSQQKVAAAIQTFYTAVVGTSTGAMKTFKVALVNTGVGAIVLAIGYLIGNFEKVKKVVMEALGPFKIFGDVIGGIINWITDFVGATSDASRALDELEKKAQEGLEKDKLAYESNSDLYDEFTKRKIKASLDYRDKIGEINRNEKLSVEEKEQAIADAHARMQRDIAKADDDAAAERQKFFDDYRKKEEDAQAKTNKQKLDLEEKRQIEQLAHDKDFEAKRDTIHAFFENRRIEDAQKEADEKRKKANEEAKKHREDVKKILEDYDKREADARADTNLKKINLEEERALAELKLHKATEAQKLKITKYYNNLRREEEERKRKETEKIAKDKDEALKALAFEKRRWEAERMTDEIEKLKELRKIMDEEAALERKKLQEEINNAETSAEAKADAEIRLEELKEKLRQQQIENDEEQKKIADERLQEEKDKKQEAIDAEEDPRKKFKKQLELYEQQRVAMQKQADFEIQKLRDIADSTTHSLQERADAEAQLAAVKQNLEKSLADLDKQNAETKEQNAESVKQNSINIATSTAKTLLELGGKGAELAKGMAVAQAIQDTYKGANAAYASMATIPGVGPALGVAAAGVAVASGLMNVKKILATKKVEKSAPGAGGGAAGGGAAPAAPAFNLVQGTGSNQIAESLAGQNTPIQAYVVSSNVTSAQSLDRNIVEQSTL